MPLSVFVDALPFTVMQKDYIAKLDGEPELALLKPNVGYSSTLHWQLYCNKYPNETGAFVDWVHEDEKSKAVSFVSKLCAPLDCNSMLGVLARKILNKFVFRRNAYANIPFKFRPYFTEKGKYLFWDKSRYSAEKTFDGYVVISQDEGHHPYLYSLRKLEEEIQKGTKDIFAVFGFTDAIGHVYRRGAEYDVAIAPDMDRLFSVVDQYREKHPDEEVLIVSDHGMSTVERKVELDLIKLFGKQSKKTYIAYCDSAIMCVFTDNEELKNRIGEYLLTREEGHLLTEDERKAYGIDDKKFGALIYNLREGNVFANNWFGKSVKKPRPTGSGMHGFWPELEAKDQMASIVLYSQKRKLEEIYDYPAAYKLIMQVMQPEKEI